VEDEGIRFATVGAARVAFQVHGTGDLDLVYSPGLASHLDITLENPRYRSFVEALTRYGRVIRFDRRGSGVSDAVPPGAGESWESWNEDLTAVLDAAGSRRAVVIATNDAGPAGILFAATQPDRTEALVLFNTTVRFGAAPDYPEGHPPEVAPFVLQVLRETWGTEASSDLLCPSLAADEPHRRWYARFQRAACAPGEMLESMERVLRLDARHVLREVHRPTLVLHRADYSTVPPAQARYIAEHIDGAVYVELEGADATAYTQGVEQIVTTVGQFIGRASRAPADDRRFTTVVFTDIVRSTEIAAELGDHAWYELLDRHDRALRDLVGSCSGRVVKSTGDGLLAFFDAPTKAVEAALRVAESVAALGLEVRVGVHAGPVVHRNDGDITGLAVNVAARVLGQAGAGVVLATDAVAGLVTEGSYVFLDRGEHTLKGVPGRHRLYEITA
jgi:class 3 adenylate cyclase